MAKLAQTSVKYVVKASFEADGLVERPDIIGALFGQTEGLLGPELDFRELQRTGRLGRIEVDSQAIKGKAKGLIIIPSSLDGTETALIAAALETIDRVGPCNAKIKVDSVEDLRTIKRKYIIDRAKELLSGLLGQIPDTTVVTEELMESIRSAEITEYKGLPAGPDAATSDSVILCEGRADVVNLLRHGVKNAIALGGTAIPQIIAEIAKEKEVVAFLDGDRGGDIILKELKAIAEVDYVARAPEGKEVEELTKKEVFKALRDKVPAEQAVNVGAIPMNFERSEDSRQTYQSNRPRFEQKRFGDRVNNNNAGVPINRTLKPTPIGKSALTQESKEFFKTQLNELIGTRAAAIFDKNNNFAGRVPIKELEAAIQQVTDPHTIVLDESIDLKIVKIAEKAGVLNLVGPEIHPGLRSRTVNVFSMSDLEAATAQI